MTPIQLSAIKVDQSPVLSLPATQEKKESPKSWHERGVAQIDAWEQRLDHLMPACTLQKKADLLGHYIDNKFSALKEWNIWLNSNGNGICVSKLAICLAKLPFRAARNILHLFYQIIKAAAYAPIHPLKTSAHLAKLLITLLHALQQPETWSHMGVGMMGTSIGQATALANPVSLLGIALGGTLAATGATLGLLKAAWQNRDVKEYVASQAEKLPETFLTNLFMGLLLGAVQRIVEKTRPKLMHKHVYKVGSEQEAKAFVDRWIKEHNLPQDFRVIVDKQTGEINIWFNSLEKWRELHPEFFADELHYPADSLKPDKWVQSIRIDLKPESSGDIVVTYFRESYRKWGKPEPAGAYYHPLSSYGMDQINYPAPPPIFQPTTTSLAPLSKRQAALCQKAFVAGAVPALSKGNNV